MPLVLQVPLPVLELPFNVTIGLLAQILSLFPALTFGACVNVIVKLSVTALQPPLPVVVSISNTLPAVVSALLGL